MSLYLNVVLATCKDDDGHQQGYEKADIYLVQYVVIGQRFMYSCFKMRNLAVSLACGETLRQDPQMQNWPELVHSSPSRSE